jgi:hypothetical protein
MSAHFTYWKNEIADMPEQDGEGHWYDLETGLAYDPSGDYGHRSGGSYRSAGDARSLEKAKAARLLAKQKGGKALKGSPKQKSWGESIREEALKKTSLSDVLIQYLLTGDRFQFASFWIEERDNVLDKEYLERTFGSEAAEAVSALNKRQAKDQAMKASFEGRLKSKTKVKHFNKVSVATCNSARMIEQILNANDHKSIESESISVGDVTVRVFDVPGLKRLWFITEHEGFAYSGFKEIRC